MNWWNIDKDSGKNNYNDDFGDDNGNIGSGSSTIT